jgi:hypothetical protein
MGGEGGGVVADKPAGEGDGLGNAGRSIGGGHGGEVFVQGPLMSSQAADHLRLRAGRDDGHLIAGAQAVDDALSQFLRPRQSARLNVGRIHAGGVVDHEDNAPRRIDLPGEKRLD